MKKFDKTVPFDPGFSKLSFSLIENVALINQDFSKLKANHQKKFWLIKNETAIYGMIEKCASFYLGCILWGSFISCRFKSDTKEISGNTTDNMTKEDLKELDCAVEAKFGLEYINSLNRDFKYFTNRPAKINPFLSDIFNAYIEFAQINKNFIGIKSTDNVQVPSCTKHFEKLSNQELDELCEKIYSIIDSAKIEKLLDLKFYKN